MYRRISSSSGTPIHIKVLVFGTNSHIQSDEHHYFNVENVPEVERYILISFGSIVPEEVLLVLPRMENFRCTIPIPTEKLKLSAFELFCQLVQTERNYAID